jgi:hypothetical protein
MLALSVTNGGEFTVFLQEHVWRRLPQPEEDSNRKKTLNGTNDSNAGNTCLGLLLAWESDQAYGSTFPFTRWSIWCILKVHCTNKGVGPLAPK